MTFHLTTRQLDAQHVLASDAKNLMLFGGSRSGKTFLLVRNVIMRALKAPNSRHAIFRYRFNAIKASIVLDTFPKVMRLAFPGVTFHVDKTDWFATFPNGAQIWFGGLDDKERAEKILGMEFVTIYFNESSQIPYASILLAMTRLAQQITQVIDGRETALKPRIYFDMNPPSKAHWSYLLFILKIDPEDRTPIKKPTDYEWFKINPDDNRENVSEDYLATLDSLPARLRKRFKDGDFADATPGALFSDEVFERYRVTDGIVPDLVRVVVAVDPSGSGDVDNADNDEIGIMVAGLGTDGIAYILEDCTVKAGPATWGLVATTAYDRHQADIVVGETNYGGAMVNSTIQTARPRTPFKAVTATRGKHVRAEPFSALAEQGKIRHVGQFPQLETELGGFNTNGYVGLGSPNRGDAWVWALAELFPAMVKPREVARQVVSVPSMRTGFNARR